MLDLRVLNYFLTVAREESITHAAEALHLSQPTLSRQLRDMEEMLGKELMIRGPRRITLTEEGLFLKKRAEEILSLASHTEEELRSDDTELNGTIRIGSAESDSVRFLMHAAHDIQARYPHLHFHITSGDGQQMMELLDKSLIDMAVVYGHVDMDKYEVLPCPTVDRWGLLLRRDNPLSQKEKITPQDLWDEKLIVSNQVLQDDNQADRLRVWLKSPSLTCISAPRTTWPIMRPSWSAKGWGPASCWKRSSVSRKTMIPSVSASWTRPFRTGCSSPGSVFSCSPKGRSNSSSF